MAIQTSLGSLDMRVLGFYTKSEVKEDGSVVTHDYVKLCPPGQAERAVSNKRVDKIMKSKPEKEMAYAYKRLIEEPYRLWKAGQTMPETGTPIGAFPGINQDQAEVFKAHGIRTVEEIAEMSERERNKIPLPGMIALVEMAKRFLEARAGAHVTDALKKKDDEIAELKTQLEDLASLVKGSAEPKRGPGRPSNAELAARADSEKAA